MAEEHHIQAWVDTDLCKGSGPCFIIAPKAFELDENMKAVVLDPAEESEDALLDAARECPTAAIYLWEGDEQIAP